jgi:hypothetical protein
MPLGELLECTLRSQTANQDFGLEFEDCPNTYTGESDDDSHAFIKVSAVKPGGPAAEEGTIAVGDTLILIGNNSASGRNSEQLVSKTLAKVTTIHLTVFRSDPSSEPGDSDTFEEQTTGSDVKFFVNCQTNEVWWATPPSTVSKPAVTPKSEQARKVKARRSTRGSSYPIDCGGKSHKYLSWEQTQHMIDTSHPRQQVRVKDEIVAKPWSLREHFGMHSFKKHNERTELQQYGVGIVLYFKLLKSMFCLFLFLTMLAVPTLVIFHNSSSDMVGLQDTFADNLTKISAASFGEQRRICATSALDMSTMDPVPSVKQLAENTDVLKLSCPSAAHSIGLIDVFFGNPEGYCGCPSTAVTNKHGECPADTGLGYEPMDKQRCCAAGAPPDFREYWPKAGTCDSSAAADHATAACVGLANCTLSLRTMYQKMHKANEGGGPCAKRDEYTLLAVATCSVPELHFKLLGDLGVKETKEDLAFFITLLDAVACFIFLLVLMWLRQKEEEEINTVDDASITAGDYSVYIHALPKHSNVNQLLADLTKFLNTALNTEAAKTLARNKRGDRCAGVDVHVAYGGIRFALSDSELINLQQKRALVLDKLEVMRARVSRLEEQIANKSWSEAYAKKRTDKQKEALRHLLCKIVKIDSSIEKHLHLHKAKGGVEGGTATDRDSQGNPLQEQSTPKQGAPGSTLLEQSDAPDEGNIHASRAFVTFEHEEGQLRCLEQFREGGVASCCCGCCLTCTCGGYVKPFIPVEKQFNHRPLVIRQAPEPSDVLWENQAVDPKVRRFRRYITALATLVCLVASFVVIWFAKLQGVKISCKYPPVTPPVEKFTKDDVLSEYLMQGPDGELHCAPAGITASYCQDQPFSELSSIFFNVSACPSMTAEEPLCYSWGEDFLMMQTLANAIVIGVCVLNEVMRVVLTGFTIWERHGSISELQGALVLKLFLSKFLNTSLMVMVINANFNGFNTPVTYRLQSLGIANGEREH